MEQYIATQLVPLSFRMDLECDATRFWINANLKYSRNRPAQLAAVQEPQLRKHRPTCRGLCDQGLREKIFPGDKKVYTGPPNLVGPPSLIGAHTVKSLFVGWM